MFVLYRAAVRQPEFRPPPTVVGEVDALSDFGVRHFRIGRQADILAYGGDGEAPNPDALRQLYSGIREVAPDLETLHLDNVNPITVVEWPEKSREGLRIIAEHNTPGDTAAFGLESADPVVQEENNLNVSAESVSRPFGSSTKRRVAPGWAEGLEARRRRERGPEDAPAFGDEAPRRLPKLLPGINLLHGLKGEREETYERNLAFLRRVYDEGTCSDASTSGR